MQNRILVLLSLLTMTNCIQKKNDKVEFSEFQIGIIADCQYCDCKTKNNRFYRSGPLRLEEAVQSLNEHSLAYTIHLGDFIDRNFESFDSLLPIWNHLKSEKYQVLGNHDFSVADSLKLRVTEKMDIQDRYYSYVKNNWRFIVLDGNDLSQHGALTETKKKQTDSLFNLLSDKNLPNLAIWNGGLSTEQLRWVDTQLKMAMQQKQRVGFFCHFPALGIEQTHNLWNYEQLLTLMDNYTCVKFFFNGHNHNGDYVQRKGVHYLTFKGMVDTKDSSSFATVSFRKDTLFVKGYGRELTRSLKIK